MPKSQVTFFISTDDDEAVSQFVANVLAEVDMYTKVTDYSIVPDIS